MIAFGVCVGNEDTYKRHALPSISALAEPDTMLLSSRDNTSIFEAYNEMLEYLSGTPGLEALVLVHEDVELRDRRLLEKIRACMQMPDVAVAGVIGATGVTSLAWWEASGRGRCPNAWPDRLRGRHPRRRGGGRAVHGPLPLGRGPYRLRCRPL